AVDGERVKSAAEFLGIIENKKPGDIVELTILRDAQPARVRVTLGDDTSGPEDSRRF
ncbi:MAG: PDZ domain-containing protein, partial [Planctomycetaceae bacterium]|nr:PDZ domain-containing protein [Planctomycetaceae bacterium]